ncbi:16S rRNA (guanine(966)-N(2))-methyltransferase RsmD [Lentibacillus saliphilus]|uniref:16S rRNA (guanine(966)-N(2))-methyltransferase RsmD n=1 Tax=Lentibacillus saliphilus TaxID=2737028 RepID=UPI001C2F5C09|nr:16S rRNA (guanine(966)-N(2))-methyltransferase RsmD [Lentibacillus saliphilus]
MRVISGNLKGRPLKAVPGKTTRPTADKVKESVFQVMGPYFTGGRCLDLFAGSGGLGIEAISRGMDTCVFVDQSGLAIKTINANVDNLGIREQSDVHRADANRAINALAKKGNAFDLILVDPPYKKVNYAKIIERLLEHNLLVDKGLLYCEHDPLELLPESTNQLSIIKQAQYGQTIAVTIYEFSREGEQIHE